MAARPSPKCAFAFRFFASRLARVEFDAPHPRFPVEPVALVKRAVRAEDEPLRERAESRAHFDYPRSDHVDALLELVHGVVRFFAGALGASCCDDPHDARPRRRDTDALSLARAGLGLFCGGAFFCQLRMTAALFISAAAFLARIVLLAQAAGAPNGVPAYN